MTDRIMVGIGLLFAVIGIAATFYGMVMSDALRGMCISFGGIAVIVCGVACWMAVDS